MQKLKILIVGANSNFCLETSYATAVKSLHHSVIRFDHIIETKKHVRLGKVGALIHNLLHVDIWDKKMNRDLVITVKKEVPDVILIVKGAHMHYGALATIRVIQPLCKLVWIWPDTPLNLNQNNLSYARIIDLTAVYSQQAVTVFRSLGFNHVEWIPLAGDVDLHGKPINANENFDCDISFVGMWRPEREKVMQVVNKNFSSLKIEIYGENWKRDCKDKNLLKKWKGEGIYARELANYFSKSRININIIDDTNYPAANMRFFEIPTAGGLELCSSCPEMEGFFLDSKDVVYFKDEGQLIEKIDWILTNPKAAQSIRRSAQTKINEDHNYASRMQKIVDLLFNLNKGN